jgi:hypothetical protein
MKCIKAIKANGNSKIGDIIRVDELTAMQRVEGGSWMYTSKSEWKNSGKIVKKEEQKEIKTVVIEDEVPVKKTKFKKGKSTKK